MNSPIGRNRPICAICGSSKNIQFHHIGGRNHLAWVVVPLCRAHHRQCHIQLENIAVNLEFTPNPLQRLIRASQAVTIFLWMINEAAKQCIAGEINN